MLMIGTGDTLVGAAHEYRQTYETLPSPDKTRVLFENANHSIFGNACPAYPGMAKAGFYWICSDAVWDMDRAHDLLCLLYTSPRPRERTKTRMPSSA